MTKADTMLLPVRLTELEIAIRARELAQAEGELSDCEERLERHTDAAKATKKQIEEEQTHARSEVRRLARIVRDGKELREVELLERPDFERGVMVTYRDDTLEEVRLRQLTEAERQRKLFQLAEDENAVDEAGEAS